MFDLLKDFFSYAFIIRAIIVGVLISLCASLLGVTLVLKRYSMIGDGLSHVGFGSLAVAAALHLTPLHFTIPVVVLVAFLLLKISERSKIKGDATIALISTGALAIGVIVISKSTGLNTDVCNYMFGSILTMTDGDVRLSFVLCILILIVFTIFYDKIFAITFDEAFAKAVGIKTDLHNMLIAILTAITIVLGMRMMGALLISSLLVFPAVTSMRIFKRFRTVVVSSALISVICFLIGMCGSYLLNTPTGASVVVVNIIAFSIFYLFGLIKNKCRI